MSHASVPVPHMSVFGFNSKAAPAHVSFLRVVLGYFKRSLVTSSLTTAPRVNYFDNSYEDLPDKLPLLMRKLRCLNASTSLRRVQLYIVIADDAIVQQPEFEDACVAVLAGKADSLTEQQRSLLPPFAAPATTPPELEDKALGFADRALKKHKLQCETPSEYPEIAAIPPT
ncbi:hypothetical protein PC112_g15383 [Phytophthora cactorum]|nr:hypothetical protein PC112_g15383 [Phytophthora cactorum]